MLVNKENYNMLILDELQKLESWLYKLLVNNFAKNFVYYKPMK